MDLTPFVGNKDKEAKTLDLRTNPLQERGDDGKGPRTNSNSSPTKRRFGPTTRVMTKKI